MTNAGPGATVSRAEFLNLFAAVFLPMFMAAVDQTLLATATPAIADVARRPARQLVDRGRLSARLGDHRAGLRPLRRPASARRNVLLAALGVFTLGSLACGLGADAAAAPRRARAAGPGRRRADDAFAGADRRAGAAARADALPGLLRADVHLRQHRRPGDRRLRRLAHELALAILRQPAARGVRRVAALAPAAGRAPCSRGAAAATCQGISCSPSAR